MVKGLKVSYAIIRGNFSGWFTNLKIYLSILLICIFIFENFSNVFSFAQENGYRVTPFLFPFSFTHYFIKLMIHICIVFLFVDAPFVNSLQLSLISRCGRKIWYRTQMLYLLICSFLITVFIMLLPVVRYMNLIVFQNDWGKILTTLSKSTEILHPIHPELVTRYSPIEVMGYTSIVFFLLTFLIGMVLYLCNIMFKSRSVGIIIITAFIIFDFLIHLMNNIKLVWFSPFSWIQLTNMAYGRVDYLPSTSFAIITLIGINILLATIISIVSKKKDINITKFC